MNIRKTISMIKLGAIILLGLYVVLFVWFNLGNKAVIWLFFFGAELKLPVLYVATGAAAVALFSNWFGKQLYSAIVTLRQVAAEEKRKAMDKITKGQSSGGSGQNSGKDK